MSENNKKPEISSEKHTGNSSSRNFLRNINTFRSLKNPVYRLYFTGIMGQRASMNMQMIARSYLIYEITGSAAILGVLSICNALPILLFSVFGGVLADRIHKKYVLTIGLGGSAVISLGVAVLLSTGYISTNNEGSWWILALSAVLQGCIMGLMIPSRQAIIPEIVDEEDIMNAVSLDSTGMNILRLVSPALSGFLVDFFGYGSVYYVMTGMYIFGTVCIMFMPLTGKLVSGASNVIQDIKEGFLYIRRESTILLLLIFTLFVVVLSMPYMTLLPVFAEDVLDVGASGMGILVSVSGVGAMITSLILASLPNKKRGIMLLASGLLLGLALTVFSLSKNWALSLIIIVFVGMGQAGRMALGNTLIQYYVDPDFRGRVMSIYVMEFGLTSFGGAGAGLLTDALGPEIGLGAFSIALVVVSVLAFIFLRRLRQLD
ncbi:MAG: MFS transporter [Dehalococcoidales bacterium]|nr:MAG: MFS transporter [Dehalococcoidales bacterium]